MHCRFHELGGNMFKWNEQGVDESPPAAVNPCHFVLPKLRHYLQICIVASLEKLPFNLWTLDNVCQWKLGKMQEIMTAIKQVRGWAERRQKRSAQVLIHSLLNLPHFHILTSIFFHFHSLILDVALSRSVSFAGQRRTYQYWRGSKSQVDSLFLLRLKLPRCFQSSKNAFCSVLVVQV